MLCLDYLLEPVNAVAAVEGDDFARVTGIAGVCGTVVIPVLVQAVSEITLDFQTFDRFYSELGSGEEIVVGVTVLVVGIVKDSEHSVHHVVVVGERSIADAGAVRVMSRIAGKGMYGHKAECSVHTASSRILVIGRVVACVVGQAYISVYVKIDLGAEIVLVQFIGISPEYSLFIIVTS